MADDEGGGEEDDDAYPDWSFHRSNERILVQLSTWDYEYILYSCDTDDHGLLGAGLFRTTLGKDVVEYISDKIHNLPDELEQRKKANAKQMSLSKIRHKEEIWLGQQAKLTFQNNALRAYMERVTVEVKKLKRQRGGYGML